MPSVIDFEGCKLSYTRSGSGPCALFIQGVGVYGSGWQPQTSVLDKSYTCLQFDNRGLGEAKPNYSEITVPQMAKDALAVLDHAGGTSAHVVGHSLGGLIALQLALDNPQRVRSLSLLCTFTGSRTAAPLSARLLWLGMRSRIGTRSMRRAGFVRLVMPPGATMDHRKLGELFGHDIADQPPVVDAQLRAMRATDLSARLHELNKPTLILSAVHDPIAPPSAGKALHKGIAGSKYIESDNASHGLPISHAEWVNDHLLKHFDSAEGNSPDGKPV